MPALKNNITADCDFGFMASYFFGTSLNTKVRCFKNRPMNKNVKQKLFLYGIQILDL